MSAITNLSVGEILAMGFIVLIGLHLAVRVATAAYFRSKTDFERKHHGTKK